jgi:hypothetical protein
MVVLGIEKINYEVAGSPFEIKKVSSHSNYDGDKYSGEDDKDYSKKKYDYLRIVTPNSGTVWDSGSYQSVTWATSGSGRYSNYLNFDWLACNVVICFTFFSSKCQLWRACPRVFVFL